GDPDHLPEGGLAVGDVAEHPLRPAGVERAGGEAQLLGVALLEGGRHRAPRLAAGGLGDHVVAEVDADDPAVGGDEGGDLPGVVAGAAAEVEDGLAGLQRQPAQQVGPGGPDVRGVLNPVEEADEDARILEGVDHGEHPDVLNLRHGASPSGPGRGSRPGGTVSGPRARPPVRKPPLTIDGGPPRPPAPCRFLAASPPRRLRHGRAPAADGTPATISPCTSTNVPSGRAAQSRHPPATSSSSARSATPYSTAWPA